MAVSSKRASGSGEPARRGAAVVADRVSKLYPGRPVTMFPPIVSIFQRELFKRKRSDSDSDPQVPRSRRDDLDFDEEDEDEDEEDFLDEHVPPPRARPDEDFWALKDVSFRVPPGGALGVLGAPASGKTTLLAIIGGHTLPTEGRVLVRDPVSPLPAKLMRALALSDKDTFDFNLVFGSRLIGLHGGLTKRHEQEIMKLAAPLVDAYGDPVRGWTTRLAIATSVVVPGNVLLLEEDKVMDAEFTARVVERARERVKSGTALVVASRTPALLRELCDEMLVLDEGKVVDRGGTQAVLQRLQSAPAPGRNGDGTGLSGLEASPDVAPAHEGGMWRGRKLRIPTMITPFNDWVALRSVRLSAASGESLKRVHESDELCVEVEVETAVPGVQVELGVDFTPAKSGEPGVRIAHPEQKLQLDDPGTSVFVARTSPGTLPSGPHEVRVDAVVTSRAPRGRTVIARDAGRVRIVGEELGDGAPAGELVEHWDGGTRRLAEARWSVE